MRKAEALKHWQGLEANQNPVKHFLPIPYKTSGSRFGACGIRIDGTPAFIDSVLSRLKDLIACENHSTRLELARNTVKPVMGKHFENSEKDAEVCYIRVHERGREAQIVNAIFGT